VPESRRPAGVVDDATRLSSQRMDLAALADVKLADSNGASHRLGDVWDKTPTVLVFLRHFG
jgi:hypothetical protein